MNRWPITTREVDELRWSQERAVYRANVSTGKRIRAVLAHLAEGESLSAVASSQSVSRRALCGWIARYRSDGVRALETTVARGRKSRLSREVLERLKLEIEGGNVVKVKHALAWLKRHWGKEVKRATARYWFERYAPLNLRNAGRQIRRRKHGTAGAG